MKNCTYVAKKAVWNRGPTRIYLINNQILNFLKFNNFFFFSSTPTSTFCAVRNKNNLSLAIYFYYLRQQIVGSLRDREVACSASDRQGSNFGSCVWRTVSSHLSHHPQEVLLAQFSLYVHKGGLKPDSFNLISVNKI